MPSFSLTESNITTQFKVDHSFLYKSMKYTILNSGKPSPSKGECKTDCYILTKDHLGDLKEFKISIKQKNADFLENKMSLKRATQIFGKDYKQIIINSIDQIKDDFLNDYLVTFKKFGRTEEKTMKIGWKFELLNKTGGKRSAELKLSNSQLADIYSGINLDDSKKNSIVNGKIIEDSGIANFIFIADRFSKYSSQEVINGIMPIDEYIVGKKIFFACKAVNYRMLKDKWDGDRPLSVYVDWSEENGKIYSKLIFDTPLLIKANQVGNNIQRIIKKLKITEDNFNELKQNLINTKYYD